MWLLFRELARLRDYINRFRHLRIVRHDEHAIAHHPAVRRRHEIEPQFQLDKRAILINSRGVSLVLRIAVNEISKSAKHRICDFQLVRLQFVIEVDARDLARLETFDSSVYELAGESEGRTQQSTLRQVRGSRIDVLIRRDAAATVNRAP